MKLRILNNETASANRSERACGTCPVRDLCWFARAGEHTPDLDPCGFLLAQEGTQETNEVKPASDQG